MIVEWDWALDLLSRFMRRTREHAQRVRSVKATASCVAALAKLCHNGLHLALEDLSVVRAATFNSSRRSSGNSRLAELAVAVLLEIVVEVAVVIYRT